MALTTFDVVQLALGVGLGAYLAWVLTMRFQSGADPSLRWSSESGTGYAGVLVSGVKVTMLLAGGLAVVTWPAVVRFPWLGVLLVGAVVVHYALERREVRG